jgi:hypothetical protein
MIKKSITFLGVVCFVLILALTAWPTEFIQNPDPNHTHADFAVWIDEERIIFSGDEYMSGLSIDEASHDEDDEYHHEHLHLHDNVGHVVHRHKPGLTLHAFFDSLGVYLEERDDLRMFIHTKEVSFDLGYVFKDLDRILITNSTNDKDVAYQLEQLTRDACIYSRMCPWRGDPPEENCIADPSIPCVAPSDFGFGL